MPLPPEAAPPATPTPTPTPTTPFRWWIYQHERFPLAQHGPLIAAFSLSAVAFSSMLRGQFDVPPWPSLLVAFVTCLLIFLQLRIADEFKDIEEDTRFRPYRAVPRGLVKLWELGVVFVICGVVQLGLAVWLDARLVVLLGVTWVYLALMSKEFFVRDWLSNRPVLYMVSHMIIMPLVDLYATATDWLLHRPTPPEGLEWFLLASFFNGMVIELGRKIRSPADEEEGVRTYSALWGRGAAVAAWSCMILATWACALFAASYIGFTWHLLVVFLLVAVPTVVAAWRFLSRPIPGRGVWIEVFSALWTLALYIGIGVFPLIWKGVVHG